VSEVFNEKSNVMKLQHVDRKEKNGWLSFYRTTILGLFLLRKEGLDFSQWQNVMCHSKAQTHNVGKKLSIVHVAFQPQKAQNICNQESGYKINLKYQ